MLGIAYDHMSFPLLFRLLPKRGNSNHKERIDIMQRFIRLFGRGSIKCLVADREFVGLEWFKWLNDNAVQYHIRIRDNFWVEDPRTGKKIRARHIFNNLKHGEERILHHIYRVCGELCYLSEAMIKDKAGKLFTCHKFRTMTVRHNGSSVSVAGDSRITPFGAKLRHYKIDELPELWDVLIGNMSFVGPRPDVPGYADKLQGADRDVLKLRPGITGLATLKSRLEDEMISDYVAKRQSEDDKRPMRVIATEYNDTVIYPDKVRLNCWYYRHYLFWKDIEMIFATLFGFRVKFAGEEV